MLKIVRRGETRKDSKSVILHETPISPSRLSVLTHKI